MALAVLERLLNKTELNITLNLELKTPGGTA